jgi:hypothetical protein
MSLDDLPPDIEGVVSIVARRYGWAILHQNIEEENGINDDLLTYF